ncbi:unnamed protein product [Lactuca virosa]|uniref:Ubiquitin-like protease family profile domain-containing protein n=1 Tax=Lactuca virosa TaxID=75947 RepID=A0AAU9M8Y1_9ASTR|nr:unnamed protein product [Lactuca virosa]
MSSDKSTRSVKKKKKSTKALVKRLIGVVADLTSKVDRLLQKKDKPDTGFSEEEDMVNEEEEETYYHGTELHYDDTFTHDLEGEVGHTPTGQYVEQSPDVGQHHKKTVTPIVRPQRMRGLSRYQRTSFKVVLFLINVIGVHWFLAVLHLNTWKVNIYDLARSMNFFSKYKIGAEFKNFGDNIISELDVIEYWNDFPDGHRDNVIVEFVEAIDAPQ